MKGEVTAFLSLIILLLLSFIGTIIESASVQVSKNYARAQMSQAIDCVFAEFQKDTLEQYDIFTNDTTLETGNFSQENITDRLTCYGATGDHQIKRIQYLSDRNGCAFYEQAVRYMHARYGLDKLEGLFGESKNWEQNKKQSEDAENTEKNKGEELSDFMKENKTELPQKDNPLVTIEQLKKRDILELVLPSDVKISNRAVDTKELPSHRALNQGWGSFPDEIEDGLKGNAEKLFFGEYILEHFSYATQGKEKEVPYEVEYVLMGKGSDRENLKAVLSRLLIFRFGFNYAYLQGSATRQNEARGLALTLTSAIGLPIAEELVTQALLLAWAFGESIMDLRSLMQREKVPLMKDDSNWKLAISGLMNLGTQKELPAVETEGADGGVKEEGTEDVDGVSYQDYLRILLFLQEKSGLSMRALDMVEVHMQEAGLDFFRVDQCMNKIEVESEQKLRRGITYKYATYYAYE